MKTRDSWIVLPENRAAAQAVERVLYCVRGRGPRRAINPLFVAGPPGCGKSLLAVGLIHELTRQAADVIVAVLPAADLVLDSEQVSQPADADLLVIEDVQQLPARGAGALERLVDHCLPRQRQLLLTANRGPAGLTHLPARLTSRLGQGLVTAIEPLSPASRLAFLQQRAGERRLRAGGTVLDWLAAHTDGSPRQLDGALTRLHGLTASLGRPPQVDELAEAFGEDADARAPNLERITRRVGRYFQIEPRELRSARRSREVLLPRQVGMYLARQLTGLTLEQIGAYFGGRDHSTVLHACRKVEQALTCDARLGGAVRELQADLG